MLKQITIRTVSIQHNHCVSGGAGGGGPGGGWRAIRHQEYGLMNARSTYLLGLSDFTCISAISATVTK